MNVQQLDNQEIDAKVARFIADAIKTSKHMNLGLATGSTYIQFYKELVSIILQEDIPIGSIKTFNLDKYFNQNPNTNSSFESFMDRHLFKPLAFQEDQTFFPEYESSADYGSYDQLINAQGGIDILLLGIGVNAHIAFNEPGTPFSSKTHKIELAPSTIESNKEFFDDHEIIPKEAVTMGISTILNAKKIILMAKGENKANAIHDMIHAPISESVPATALRLHENVEVYVDKEAGSLI